MILKKLKWGEKMEGGGWWFATTDKRDRVVMFHCPICNANSMLASFGISKQGVVDKNVPCGCGQFDQQVTLEDWPPVSWKVATETFVFSL